MINIFYPFLFFVVGGVVCCYCATK